MTVDKRTPQSVVDLCNELGELSQWALNTLDDALRSPPTERKRWVLREDVAWARIYLARCSNRLRDFQTREVKHYFEETDELRCTD